MHFRAPQRLGRSLWLSSPTPPPKKKLQTANQFHIISCDFLGALFPVVHNNRTPQFITSASSGSTKPSLTPSLLFGQQAIQVRLLPPSAAPPSTPRRLRQGTQSPGRPHHHRPQRAPVVWRVWRVGVVGLGVRAPRGGLSELIGAPFLEGLEFCCGCVRS